MHGKLSLFEFPIKVNLQYSIIDVSEINLPKYL